MLIGVLAIQGDFQEHIDVLRSMKIKSTEVRTKNDLKKIDALILPGGESTVMAKMMEKEGLFEEIRKRVAPTPNPSPARGGGAKGRGLKILGTCAGAILLAKNVTGKHPPKTLGLLDITVERNAYGTQHESFEARIKIGKEFVLVSFIRAPKITKVGKDVDVIATFDGSPVLVRQGNIVAATFHTEVQGVQDLHKLLHQL